MTREPVVWGLRSKSLRCLEEVLAFKGPSTRRWQTEVQQRTVA